MATSAAGKFASTLCTVRGATRRGLNLGSLQSSAFLQARNYAARKGTREKAQKKKVKVVVQKLGFIPHKERGENMAVLSLEKLRFDDVVKEDIPEDDVWIGRYHKMKIYSFAEAIQCHKETHSMGMLDAPNAFVKALIELDMTGPKPSRPVTKFARIVATPHVFDHAENRTLVAFCATPELQEQARQAGATLVGGPELISQIQTGEIAVADYDYAVADPHMLANLVMIKGLMKKKFPNANNGSLGIDVSGMIKKFLHGIKYGGHPHERQQLFGTAETLFGRLNMETKQLEDNFAAVINDMNSYRPKRPGPFITRIRITTELSKEFLKVDHKLYEPKPKAEDDDDDDDDDDDENEPVAIAAQ